MLSPGALKPRLPIELPRFRFAHRAATSVTGHDRDDPRMTGDGGASEGALIAGCGNYDHSASGGLIECVFQRLLSFFGRLCKGKAQVNYSYTCVDAIEHRGGKFVGCRAGQALRPEVVSVKMGRTKRVQFGQMAGAGEFRFADSIPATKVPCRHAVLLL